MMCIRFHFSDVLHRGMDVLGIMITSIHREKDLQSVEILIAEDCLRSVRAFQCIWTASPRYSSSGQVFARYTSFLLALLFCLTATIDAASAILQLIFTAEASSLLCTIMPGDMCLPLHIIPPPRPYPGLSHLIVVIFRFASLSHLLIDFLPRPSTWQYTPLDPLDFSIRDGCKHRISASPLSVRRMGSTVSSSASHFSPNVLPSDSP